MPPHSWRATCGPSPKPHSPELEKESEPFYVQRRNQLPDGITPDVGQSQTYGKRRKGARHAPGPLLARGTRKRTHRPRIEANRTSHGRKLRLRQGCMSFVLQVDLDHSGGPNPHSSGSCSFPSGEGGSAACGGDGWGPQSTHTSSMRDILTPPPPIPIRNGHLPRSAPPPGTESERGSASGEGIGTNPGSYSFPSGEGGSAACGGDGSGP